MLANTIQSIMSTDMTSLREGAFLKEAVTLMSERTNGCIIINKNHYPVGIITERDITRIAAVNLDICRIKVEEVMTSPVKTVARNMDIYEAALYLQKNNIRRIIIVDHSGKLLGLVSQTDLKNHLGSVYYIKLKAIESIMTAQVVTATYEEKLSASLRKMSENRLSCMVVCRGNTPVGILTERDVTRLIAKEESFFNLDTKQVMISPLITTSRKTSIFDATRLMKTKNIRRLVVVNDKNLLEGLVTESDVIKHLDTCCLESLRHIVDRDRAFINTLKEGVFEAYPQTSGIITWINRAGAEMLGYRSCDELVGKKLEDIFLEPGDFKKLLELLNTEGEARDFLTIFKQSSGRQFYVEGTFDSFTDDFDGTTCMKATFRNITERKKMDDMIRKKVEEQTIEIREKNKQLQDMNVKLQELSIRDGLTNLRNFRYFSEMLKMEFAKAKRYNLPLACIIIDIDDFKFINDNYGHAAGDYALIKTARLMEKIVRETDIVARYGGDEFTVILPNTDLKRARVVGDKILTAFRKYELKKDSTSFGKISLSIGISALPNDRIKTDKQLMEYADKSMYRAKEHGKDNICFFEPE